MYVLSTHLLDSSAKFVVLNIKHIMHNLNMKGHTKLLLSFVLTKDVISHFIIRGTTNSTSEYIQGKIDILVCLETAINCILLKELSNFT